MFSQLKGLQGHQFPATTRAYCREEEGVLAFVTRFLNLLLLYGVALLPGGDRRPNDSGRNSLASFSPDTYICTYTLETDSQTLSRSR